jgi:hypothetical protein
VGNFLAVPGPVAILELTVYGSEVVLKARAEKFTVLSSDGKLLDTTKGKTSIAIADTLTDLARSILMPAEHKLAFDFQSDLATMSFIEAAYLSDRTAMPESANRKNSGF